MTEDREGLAAAISDCQDARVKTLIEEKLAAGVDPADIVAECNQGMVVLGNRFACGDCFLPELMVGGMIMKGVMAKLGPRLLQTTASTTLGTAVIGSVQHDVHDIGKDIVVMMLRGVGFAVIDLGVDAPPAKFVEAIRVHRPQVTGMSVLLTTCFKSVLATVEAIQAAGLRDTLKLMVGGAAASDLLSRSAGCDFYAKTAVDGMNFARALAPGK